MRAKNKLSAKFFFKPSHKGCSAFGFFDSGWTNGAYLNQFSDNPAVYTKLSCYLPWVAAQYNMEYRPTGVPDSACLNGQGDITEVTAKVCRTNPVNTKIDTSWADTRDGIEAPCLFPFSLNGESHNSCIMDQIEDFTRPVFRCPIRTVKGAGSNGTEYTDTHLTAGVNLDGYFCPTNR